MPDAKLSGGKLAASLRKVPPWAWLLGLGAIVVLYLIGRRTGKASTGEAQPQSSAQPSLLDYGAPSGASASIGVGGSPVLNPGDAGRPSPAPPVVAGGGYGGTAPVAPPLASTQAMAGSVRSFIGYSPPSYNPTFVDYSPPTYYSQTAVQVAGTGYTGYVSTPTNAGGNSRVGSGAAID